MIQNPPFTNCQKKDGSVSIHKRNLHSLPCEMFEIERGMPPELIKELILLNRNIGMNYEITQILL